VLRGLDHPSRRRLQRDEDAHRGALRVDGPGEVSHEPWVDRDLGLVAWIDSGLTTANRVPWGHVDVRAVRRRAQTLLGASGVVEVEATVAW
jgi:hypothetical protein